MDALTRSWLRGPADEKAVARGCRFDEERAKFAVDWIERYCVLYEGDAAGQPLKLRDWQLEFVMRLFGWVRHSAEHGKDIRRFTRASVYIAKKNKKTPTIAAIGLHLLSGDGEPGQKVFSCAKDGKQAMLAHTHAMEMTRRSPELLSECAINRTTGRITHEPTRSFYDVISGDNIEGQEGLNGSVIVDETHVVDERLMKRLKYAGISRREPLHIEVSTAGTNPDSYGKRQFDHAVSVQAGLTEDQELLAMVYAAPQDLSDADLDADPVKYGKMANPAWGHTIREEEFLSSYHAAKKKSISDLLDFKMYRLNIWQRSSNPWLRASVWDDSGRPIDMERLKGLPCNAALDMGKVSDPTAFIRLFTDPDDPNHIIMIPTFWMPRAYAAANNHLVPFLEWERQGFLIITEGDVADYGHVRGTIRNLHKETPIKEIAYDETYAEEMTQALSSGVMDETGKVIEEGIGCERVIFKQNIMTFAKPTDDYERQLIAGTLHHNHNPMLTWMAGHCEVYRDVNGNKRPVKPDGRKGGLKKIDGIVVGIMALARYKKHEPNPYSYRGLTFV